MANKNNGKVEEITVTYNDDALKRDVICAIRSGSLYDLIANKYYLMSNWELATILKEVIFLMHEEDNDELIENLKERL